ncbi:MAG: HAMP domain-containing protein [bacterium]|nr:HAMP domain-containing protein [bacterium]
MDQKQLTNNKLIWLSAAAGFFLPFLIFIFLKSNQLGGRSYHNPWVHSLLLLIICGVAFYAAYVAYRGYKESQSVNLFITSLAFYTFGFVFFLHGLTIPDFGLFSEDLFEVAEHYGLFLGSFILLGLILPLEGLREFVYRLAKNFFWGWAAFLLIAFIVLVFSPPLAGILAGQADLFTGLTIFPIVITFLFILSSYRRSRSGLLFYFIMALAILINSAIIPFFYKEWNLLWWYFHFTFLLPFLIILLGLLKYRHEKGEIVKALAEMRSKLMTVFLLVGLFPLGILGYLNIQSARQDLEKEITNKLMLLADAKVGQVFAYLDALESRTIDFASDGLIRDLLKEIVKKGSPQAVETLGAYLLYDKKSLDSTLAGILILDLNGKVVSATDEKEIGDDESKDVYFIEGQRGVSTVEVLEQDGHFGLENSFAVSSPLTDMKTKELLGVIVNIFNTEKLRHILSGEFQKEKGAMIGATERSQTIETYLVDREKRMMASTTTIINNPLVQKCFEEQKEFSATYLNYSLKEVLGASMCIAKRGWTLVVEIGAKEAFAPIRAMQQRLILVVLLFVALVGGLALVFSRTIANPIKKLHHGAEKIGEGDLSYRVDIKTGDEIEQLANEFNSMAGKLALSYQGLEEKIQERTKKLDATNQQLRANSQTLEQTKAELEVKVQEMERFHKLTMGREEKILELKEEIKKLKEGNAK